MLADAGARVEGEIVFIDSELVERTLASAPARFTIRARDPRHDFEVGGGQPCLCTAYAGIAAKKGDEYWSSLATDVVNFAKLADSSPTVTISAPWVVIANDVDLDDQMKFQFATSLKYVTKPIMGVNDGYDYSKWCIQLLRDFYGKHGDEYLTLVLISPVSPLSYDERMLEAVFAYAEENQPLLFASYVMPGATGPVTVAGSLAVCHAEVLAGIVLAQLIRPGVPVIYGNAAGSTNLRHVTPAIGVPETGLTAVHVKALASKYGIPARAGGSLCDSKSSDMQSGIEATGTLLPTILADIDYVIASAGVIDSFNTVGYDQFLFDEEIAQFALKMKAGVSTEDEDLALDTIMAVEHGGQYLGEDHTFEHMRDSLFMSNYFENAGYATWELEGARTARQNVLAAVDKRLADYEETPLTEEQTALIADYLALG